MLETQKPLLVSFARLPSVPGWYVLALALLLSGWVGRSASAQTFKVLYTFCRQNGCKDGEHPQGGLAADKEGNLYGTAGGGNASHDGVLFKIGTKGTYSLLHTFGGGKTDGSGPDNASPVFDASGNLYGVTAYGGAGACSGRTTTGCGTVFKYSAVGTYSIVHSFKGSPNDGYGPDGGLVVDAKGNVYGTTMAGGIENSGCGNAGSCGTIFKISSEGDESVLYRFCSEEKCADGGEPTGGMQIDSEGNLYGTTAGGGTHLHGTVFKFSVSGGYKVLYDFCADADCTDGAGPEGSLALDSKGNLYGPTLTGGVACSSSSAEGCGTLFTITTADKGFSVLHSFGSLVTGIEPEGGVVVDASDNVFGTTAFGGAHEVYGTIFEYNKAKGFTLLHSFDGADGAGPYATLLDVKGVLYGTTDGLTDGPGTVFELTP